MTSPHSVTARASASATPAHRGDARAVQRTGTGSGPASMFAQMLRDQNADANAAVAADQAKAPKSTSADDQEEAGPADKTAQRSAKDPADPGDAANGASGFPGVPVSPPPNDLASMADGAALAALRHALSRGVADRQAADGAQEKSAGDRGTGGSLGAGDAALAAAAAVTLASAAMDAAAKASDDALRSAADPLAEGALPSLGAIAEGPRPSPGLPMAPPDAAPAAPAPQAQASLSAAPGTAAFAPALGLQLSTWLREGVQHASLELHPQDLGPIDVRIAMKDGQAHIDLTADVASTRAALAEALPQLSAALGDVGLSLSGGGVSDQGTNRDASQGQASGTAQARAAGGAAATLAEANRTAVPVQARPRQGLLDLFA